MPFDALDAVFLLTLVAFNLSLTYYLYRSYSDAIENAEVGQRTGAIEDAQGAVDHEDGIVQCPDCGTRNESGYEYCRSCVAELPGAMDFKSGGSGPFRRAM